MSNHLKPGNLPLLHDARGFLYVTLILLVLGVLNRNSGAGGIFLIPGGACAGFVIAILSRNIVARGTGVCLGLPQAVHGLWYIDKKELDKYRIRKASFLMSTLYTLFIFCLVTTCIVLALMLTNQY